ncbi:MAG: type II secretion system protein [Oscillatoria sp. PMC 1051.18]|nr:type II secretion system protein [Oscillatoria sp. PMC 1050.18]MEC5031076.1 type II secretion system protein [Oscillatoria sp. PMC 1051.18]
MKNRQIFSSAAGFTLIEVLVAVAIMGILAAIALPSWLNFISQQQLNVGSDRLYWAMRKTQSNAKRDKLTWNFSIQEKDGVVQYAIHPASVEPVNAIWQNLDKNIILEKSTFYQYPQTSDLQVVYRVQFNHHGNTNGRLGKVILSHQNLNQTQKCVIVSTLIGGMRTAKNKDCN